MGHEVKCPACHTAFKIDESGYAEIVKQVRDEIFEKEITDRTKLIEKSMKSSHALELERALGPIQNELAQKEQLITELNYSIEQGQTQKQLDIRNAQDPLNAEIRQLKSQIEQFEISKQLAIRDATDPMRDQIKEIEDKLLAEKTRFEAEIKALKTEHQAHLDMRTALSTKMLGESLEEHCRAEFERNQSLGLFPHATFERDTTGESRGDFVFRDYEDGVEVLSIMFEMKNQDVATEHKQKNSQHFQKLNRDRNSKDCEYAVLISLLETDSDLYNSGIVDVSHSYQKMYVVRPQCFIPIITLLRNAALRNIEVHKELIKAQEQDIDVTNFIEKLQDFKEGFSKNFGIASSHFQKAIEQIDKSIKALEATKDKLQRSVTQLSWANDKAQDLTIRKLTHDNPTMRGLFSETRVDES